MARHGRRPAAVDKAVRGSEEARTKTKGARTTALLDPLRDDIDDLRYAAGFPAEDNLIITAQDGEYWSPSQFRNWRIRVSKPILKDLASGDDSLAPLVKARIYDCRATFVSLMLRGGKSPLDVAKWAGHSPGVMFSHYANVIDELVGKDPVPAQQQIRLVREATGQIPRRTLDESLVHLIDHPTFTIHLPSGNELQIEEGPGASDQF